MRLSVENKRWSEIPFIRQKKTCPLSIMIINFFKYLNFHNVHWNIEKKYHRKSILLWNVINLKVMEFGRMFFFMKKLLQY